jgi:hypothetical protein
VNIWIKTSLIVSISALAGAIAAKVDSRSKLVCSDVPCPHFDMRMAAIESVITQQSGEPVYLAIGDSITEFAELEPICGRKPLNAGIRMGNLRNVPDTSCSACSVVEAGFHHRRSRHQ